MRRFYAPPEACRSGLILLPESETRHALKVLRLRPGAEVAVLDGRGGVFEGRLAAVVEGRAQVEAVKKTFRPRPAPELILFQAALKSRRMEWAVEKAVELGAARIAPILTARSVPDWDARQAEQKRRKWQAAALAALKQSGNFWLPEIDAPAPLARRLQTPADLPERNYVASLRPDAVPLRDRLLEEQGAERAPQSVGFWIGPEGDFTEAEERSLREAGALPVTLGPATLRSETAAIVCLALGACAFQRSPGEAKGAP